MCRSCTKGQLLNSRNLAHTPIANTTRTIIWHGRITRTGKMAVQRLLSIPHTTSGQSSRKMQLVTSMTKCTWWTRPLWVSGTSSETQMPGERTSLSYIQLWMMASEGKLETLLLLHKWSRDSSKMLSQHHKLCVQSTSSHRSKQIGYIMIHTMASMMRITIIAGTGS